MRTNLTECGIRYMSNPELSWIYGYNGTTRGIPRNFSTQATFEGCEALCGHGTDFYPWATSSATITTWILPVIGMILQAPFESNAFRRTMLAILRWLGSPMSSLSYILWNIKVSGKCALIVDMSVPYDNSVPNKESDFAHIRDSFYLLMTMNQYTMNDRASSRKSSEGLLRIVLFSRDLRLRNSKLSLKQTREKLAEELREGRKRGVVPVFVSTMWFLFALAISIQSAFGFLGENTTAHDLALGFLLSWLPVLILGGIVDRNPVAAEDVRRKLNKLVDHVRESLLNDELRNEFIRSFEGQAEFPRLEAWVKEVYDDCEYMTKFFTAFAGQGRLPWHYGAAHPILSDIEPYVASKGRNWLDNEEEARTNLVLGLENRGLIWFDFRELWQILASIGIVTFTIAGAFVISFFTPTVGLGCRSGGYLIFTCISFGLLVCELLVWWASSPPQPEEPQLTKLLSRTRTRLESNASFVRAGRTSKKLSHRTYQMILATRDFIESWMVRIVIGLINILPLHNKEDRCRRIRESIIGRFGTIHNYTLKEWTRYFFFIPVELVNTTWLCYIVFAQTSGSYHNCRCSTSMWGGGGGYIDFKQSIVTNTPWVHLYWIGGTVLGCTTMGLSMVYIVIEWCLQSHLSTENYSKAQRGLQRTRLYRRITFPIRIVTRYIGDTTFDAFCWLCAKLNVKYKHERFLLWTYKTTYWYRPPYSGARNSPRPPNDYQSQPGPRPSTDASAPFLGSPFAQTTSPTITRSHELQPYMYGSPDPGIGPSSPPTQYRRKSSEISVQQHSQSFPRFSTEMRERATSDSSQVPLIQTPKEAQGSFIIPRKPSGGLSVGLGISTPVSQSPTRPSMDSAISAISPTEKRGRRSEEYLSPTDIQRRPSSEELLQPPLHRPTYARQTTDERSGRGSSEERERTRRGVTWAPEERETRNFLPSQGPRYS
ncbi:uncharacterized protein BDZ99DRAFT_407064 [Mytilinidion resinicola]|uniref:Uncharacterized protein n=1 Tax=Mytilinidion resinicola TaxID=574789 RepID=A0A6A6Z7Z8_9PEZI|nr:uncharacterized protein BDZ99DRAFT_407064 [Mytilinidion resinicola]KAF2816347.1 hypothetical protein BDZ99DRAFT_407064 [Mytilinidion resinicola]